MFMVWHADLPLTGWSVFPLPLAALSALCLPGNPAPPAPAPSAAARASPLAAAAHMASCATPAPAPDAAGLLAVCQSVPDAGHFDPALDGPVLYRLVSTTP